MKNQNVTECVSPTSVTRRSPFTVNVQTETRLNVVERAVTCDATTTPAESDPFYRRRKGDNLTGYLSGCKNKKANLFFRLPAR